MMTVNMDLEQYKKFSIEAVKTYIEFKSEPDGEMYAGFSQATIDAIKAATSEDEITLIMDRAHRAA